MTTPDLAFGPDSTVVPDVWKASTQERPALIVGEFAGTLESGTHAVAGFGALADAITRGADGETQHGYSSHATTQILQSAQAAAAGKVSEAGKFINTMKDKGSLTAEQKLAWTEAIHDLRGSLPKADRAQLEALEAAILPC